MNTLQSDSVVRVVASPVVEVTATLRERLNWEEMAIWNPTKYTAAMFRERVALRDCPPEMMK